MCLNLYICILLCPVKIVLVMRKDEKAEREEGTVWAKEQEMPVLYSYR
jgi:hypothetical protein